MRALDANHRSWAASASMSDPHDCPAPHTVVITETAGHEPTPVLIPDSLTIDGHEVGHKVAVVWGVSAGPHGEAILGLRVDPQVVTVDDGGVYVDGHRLCWPARRS